MKPNGKKPFIRNIFFIIIFLLIASIGCGKKDGGEKTVDGNEGYVFEYDGVAIRLGEKAEPVVEALGRPLKAPFEAPSCAFDGIDRTHFYKGFEMYTYPVGGEDYVASILFTDDSVFTVEKIRLGMSLEDVFEAYGDSYTEETGLYTYTAGSTSVSFLIEAGAVSSVMYNYDNADD